MSGKLHEKEFKKLQRITKELEQLVKMHIEQYMNDVRNYPNFGGLL